MEGQHGFGADHALDTQDRTQRGLEILRVRGHHPAPDVAPAGDLVHFEDLGNQPQSGDHAVELPVGHLNRHEGDDVVSHRLEVDLAAAVVQDARAQHPAHAGLGSVPRNAEFFAQLADLDAGVADQLEQDLQICGVQGVQIVTPVHESGQRLMVLLNIPTE